MGAGTTLLASAGCTIDGGVAAADTDEERDRNTDDQGVPNPRSVARRHADAHAVTDADSDPNSHPDAHPHRIGHADAISPSDAHPVTA